MINELYLGTCKVFIRVLSPDGKVFDAIGETDQLTIQANPNYPAWKPYYFREPSYLSEILSHQFPYYSDIKLNIERFFISQQEDPVNWTQVAQDVIDKGPKQIGPGSAGHREEL